MYTNEDGEIIVVTRLSSVAVEELEQHWYRLGRDDYYDNKRILGAEFDEQNGPCEARVEQVTDFEIEDNDAKTRQFIADAYIRGWIDAAPHDTNE
jgi:protein tyrosine phosphatase